MAEDCETATERKLHLKCPESYLNYRFIATDDSCSPSPLCIIRDDQLSSEAMKLQPCAPHGDQAPCMQTQDFGVSQKRNTEQEEQKQPLRPRVIRCHQMSDRLVPRGHCDPGPWPWLEGQRTVWALGPSQQPPLLGDSIWGAEDLCLCCEGEEM